MHRAGIVRACGIASSAMLAAAIFAGYAATAQEKASKENSPQGKSAGELREFGGDLKIRMLWCPPGSFKLGSLESDAEAYNNEKPQGDVKLKNGFWLGQTEVSQSLWTSVMESSPWAGKDFFKEGAGYPACYVSHGGNRDKAQADSAQAFCVRLTKVEREAGRLPVDHEFRLPTEAEWEYACRAGATTKFSFGSNVDALGQYAWFEKNAWDVDEKYPHEAAKKRANKWGFYDMHGNVWEWCEDFYNDKPPSGVDPLQDSEAPLRVSRGGSYSSSSRQCRSAHRGSDPTLDRRDYLGFRLALSPTTTGR